MQEGIIYLITNKVNGKRYVGKTTTSLNTRWSQHLSDARGRSKGVLHKAIRKYGSSNFLVQTIAESLEPFLDGLEKFFIRLHCSHVNHYGYNLTEGGDGIAGYKHTDETKAKIALSSKNLSPETREKLSLSSRGRRHSSETRAYLSRINTNRPLALQMRMTSAMQSLEAKHKISRAHKGKPLSEEHRIKLSIAATGRRLSAEDRAKMSESAKKRWSK